MQNLVSLFKGYLERCKIRLSLSKTPWNVQISALPVKDILKKNSAKHIYPKNSEKCEARQVCPRNPEKTLISAKRLPRHPEKLPHRSLSQTSNSFLGHSENTLNGMTSGSAEKVFRISFIPLYKHQPGLSMQPSLKPIQEAWKEQASPDCSGRPEQK